MLSLDEKQLLFPNLLIRLLQEAHKQGFGVKMGETHRTPEQAAWNAKKGVGVKNSLHCLHLAVDLLLFRDGKWLTKSEDYEGLGKFWEKLSSPDMECAWGGRFKKPDGGHFSISHNGIK